MFDILLDFENETPSVEDEMSHYAPFLDDKDKMYNCFFDNLCVFIISDEKKKFKKKLTRDDVVQCEILIGYNIYPCELRVDNIGHKEISWEGEINKPKSYFSVAMQIRYYENNKWLELWRDCEHIFSNDYRICNWIDDSFNHYINMHELKKVYYKKKQKHKQHVDNK